MTQQGNDRPGTPEGQAAAAWDKPRAAAAQPLPLAGSSWEGVASHPGCEAHDLDSPPEEVSDAYAELQAPCADQPGIEESTVVPLQLEIRGITQQRQSEFWRSQTIFKNTVWAKLLSAGRHDLADKIKDCHTQESYRVCPSCNKARKLWNRCENFFCPECQPRLSRDRKQAVEWWTKLAQQPKHVVLTVRNSSTLTKDYVQSFKAAFRRLRRSAFASNWIGGFYSIEVTNEGQGWHLHLHALVESRWIDARQLSRAWARVAGQDFAIVKVKDARGKDYLREVTKYSVKGSDLAGWTGRDIAVFVDAFTGVRTFGVFGNLYGRRKEWADFCKSLAANKPSCDCGCSTFLFLSPNQLLERLETHDKSPVQGAPRPPPTIQPNLEFLNAALILDAIRQ